MTTMWIGSECDEFKVGQKGFLVRHSNPIRRSESYDLRDHPPKTNQSFQPKLYGWCGSYNDNNTFGKGMWIVERVAKNGRAFIRELEGGDLDAALEEFGYPDIDRE